MTTAIPEGALVLAGGGHSHSLLLRRWAMQPKRRPRRPVILVNRHSTALYSGMVPGVIAGIYQRQDAAIDLRRLADRARVALVIAEITGVDRAGQRLSCRSVRLSASGCSALMWVPRRNPQAACRSNRWSPL